jgi:hypothetical protein
MQTVNIRTCTSCDYDQITMAGSGLKSVKKKKR